MAERHLPHISAYLVSFIVTISVQTLLYSSWMLIEIIMQLSYAQQWILDAIASKRRDAQFEVKTILTRP